MSLLPSEDILPRNILAFRTITSILHLIQQERPFKVSDDLAMDMSPMERQELKISNAVSNLAIANNDITAVVTKRCPDTLVVIACTHLSNHESSFISPQPPTAISRIFQYLFTKNFRRDDPKSPTWDKDPTIINAIIPLGLKPDDDEALKKYLEERWSKSTLATHLWIISKLLLMKDRPSDGGPEETNLTKLSDRLLLYVITTSYPKMLRRMKHKTLSIPYITSLEQVKIVPFDESLRLKASKEEIENDRLFLVRFLLPAIQESWLGLSTPKLFQQANLACEGSPFQLYTEDTCLEFHLLLSILLQKFRGSLEDLSKSRGKENVSTVGSEAFKKHLLAVMLNGYALQRIARGSALPMHLQNITPMLNDYHRANLSTQVKERRGLGYEFDEELEAVQLSAIGEGGLRKPMWRSYVDWLKLMVLHFDAVDILIRHVTGPHFHYSSISIKILVPPPVDNTLLPWRELFTDSKLFPTKNVQDPHSTKTNDEILEFLENATMSNPKESLTTAKSAEKLWIQRDVEKTIIEIELLKNSALPGIKGCAEKLYNMLCGWKAQPESPGNLILDITHSIQSLCDNAKFFADLVKMNDAPNFTGTLHCEACLASLINHSVNDNSKYEDLLIQLKDFGQVIGVSKRCCPVCRHLLYLLAKDKSLPFFVRGSHSTVSPCTLPTWLPEHFVDSMNDFFGSQLRRELIDLMGRSDLLRSRAHSTGSQRLSYESSGGGSEDIGLTISQATFQAAKK